MQVESTRNREKAKVALLPIKKETVLPAFTLIRPNGIQIDLKAKVDPAYPVLVID